MGTPNTVTSADALLKQYYGQRAVKDLYSRKFPTLSRIRKQPNTEGNPQKVPIILSDGAGVSSTYSSAAASAKGIQSSPFLVQMADFVGVVPLDHKLMKTAGTTGGKGAFVNYLKKENDAKINGIGRHISTLLFGNGGGAIGRGASLSTNTLTLTQAADAINFWPQQQISASANDGSDAAHALRSGGTIGYLTVLSVDRDAGTVTFTGTPGTELTGFVGTDYLFLRGSFAGNVTQNLIFKGFQTWFPLTAPTDTLWTVARTGTTGLAGFRVPTADQVGGVVQRVRKGAVHGQTAHGATPDWAIVHPKQWEQASISLQNQGVRIIEKAEMNGSAGYKYLSVTTGYGDIELTSDAHCSPVICHFIDSEALWISHLGDDMIECVEQNGLRMIPDPTALGFEIRYAAFCNLVSDEPWKCGSIPLAVVS